jgi:hypothetical protein
MTLENAIKHCLQNGARFRKINPKGRSYCTIFNPNEVHKRYCQHLCVSRIQVEIYGGVLIYNACDYKMKEG